MNANLNFNELIGIYRLQEVFPDFANAKTLFIGFLEQIRQLDPKSKDQEENLRIMNTARQTLQDLSNELQRFYENAFANSSFLTKVRNLNVQNEHQLFEIIRATKKVANELFSKSNQPVQSILDEKIKTQNEGDINTILSGIAALKAVCSQTEEITSVLDIKSFAKDKWRILGTKIDAFIQNINNENIEIRTSLLQQLKDELNNPTFKKDLHAIGFYNDISLQNLFNYLQHLNGPWIQRTAFNLSTVYLEKAIDFNELTQKQIREVSKILEEATNQKENNIKKLWSGLATLKTVCNLIEQIESVLKIELTAKDIWRPLSLKLENFVKNINKENSEHLTRSFDEVMILSNNRKLLADLRNIGIFSDQSLQYLFLYLRNLEHNLVQKTISDLSTVYQDAEMDFNQLTIENEASRTLYAKINKIQGRIGAQALTYNRKNHGNGMKTTHGRSTRANYFGGGTMDIHRIGNMNADVERIQERTEQFKSDIAKTAITMYSNFFENSLPENGIGIIETKDLSFEGAKAYKLKEYKFQDNFDRAINLVQWLIIYFGRLPYWANENYRDALTRIQPEIQQALIHAIKNKLFSEEELICVENKYSLLRSEQLDQAVNEAKFKNGQTNAREESKNS